LRHPFRAAADTAARMTFNFVDALLATIVLIGAFNGWARGFLYATLDLMTLVASVAAAFLGYRFPAAWAQALLPQLGVWAAPLAFVVLFFLVHFLLGAAMLAVARTAPPEVHRATGNRLLGLAPGLVNGVIFAIVAGVVLLTVPLGPVRLEARNSELAARLAMPAEWAEAQLAPIFDPAVHRTLQTLTLAPESKKSIPLHFTVARPAARPELEDAMLDLVNAERTRRGLQPLKADPLLADLARAHSRDMFARGYFSHVTPDGRDLGARMRTARLGYLAAGENLALAATLAAAHQGLMQSPGHRANILRPQFGRVGIGVLDGGAQGLMVTQDFRN
ncbi:MAG: putative rane protein, partial [Ramlibacter sp.]|nr:putative rane protein [Ramlibacter sp.]